MSDRELLQRIALDPKVMVGKPIVKGTRITVETVVNLLAHGATEREILDDFPRLSVEDIRACLLFAAKSLDILELPPISETA